MAGGFRPIEPSTGRTHADYYLQVLKAALGVAFEPAGRKSKADPVCIGTIRNLEQAAALASIAEYENTVRHRWGEAPEDGTAAPLQNLVRADVEILASLFGETHHWVNRCEAQAFANLRASPDRRKPFELVAGEGERKGELDVQVCNGAVALFLDEDEDGRAVVHQDKGAGVHPVWVWKTAPPESPRARSDGEWPLWLESTVTEEVRKRFEAGTLQSTLKAEHNWRYAFHLWTVLSAWAPKLLADRLGAFEQVWGLKGGWDTPAKAVAAIQRVLGEVKSKKVQETVAESAEDLARSTPDGYRCYYFSLDGKTLSTFIDPISSKGPGQFGGYRFRADAPEEYEWEFVQATTKRDETWSRLIAEIVRLPSEKSHGGATSLTVPGAKSRKPANSPTPKKTLVPVALPACNSGTLFQYYKVENKASRAVPAGDRSAKYLKWKKGPRLDGEPYASAKGRPRISAGAVMADALRAFGFYQELSEQAGKTCRSSLSASVLADYLFDHDDVAEKWYADQILAGARRGGLQIERTPQEWCHLFGHGDGGHEVLENFVSGSKHCNTEQLAIETGQRRITRSDSVPEECKKKLRWKVTAHLVPNGGTAGQSTLASLLEKWRSGPARSAFKAKEYKSGMAFLQTTLRAAADLAPPQLFDQLAQQIKQDAIKLKHAPNTADASDVKSRRIVLKAFQDWYQRNLFLYYPVAAEIQYRIYYGATRCFKHRFDAQSPGFDLNQARLVDFTVERAIYEAMEADRETYRAWEHPPWQTYCNSLESRIKSEFDETSRKPLVKMVDELRKLKEVTSRASRAPQPSPAPQPSGTPPRSRTPRRNTRPPTVAANTSAVLGGVKRRREYTSDDDPSSKRIRR